MDYGIGTIYTGDMSGLVVESIWTVPIKWLALVLVEGSVLWTSIREPRPVCLDALGKVTQYMDSFDHRTCFLRFGRGVLRYHPFSAGVLWRTVSSLEDVACFDDLAQHRWEPVGAPDAEELARWGR